jgi:hypothetical protein
MALADRWRRIADRYRSLPADFGLREHEVSLAVYRFRNEELGVSPQLVSRLQILVNGANPRVRFPSQQEMAIGGLSTGTLIVGPFTPQFGEGGIDRDLLDGKQMDGGEQLIVEIKGPQSPTGARYRIANKNYHRALQITMTCVPLGNLG